MRRIRRDDDTSRNSAPTFRATLIPDGDTTMDSKEIEEKISKAHECIATLERERNDAWHAYERGGKPLEPNKLSLIAARIANEYAGIRALMAEMAQHIE